MARPIPCTREMISSGSNPSSTPIPGYRCWRAGSAARRDISSGSVKFWEPSFMPSKKVTKLSRNRVTQILPNPLPLGVSSRHLARAR